MDDAVVTSLDAIETTKHLSMPSSYRGHSVSICDDEVKATREAYVDMGGRGSEQRLNAFDTCRHRAWFVRHEETGDVRVATKSCKLRWCPLCAKKKQWFLTQQFLPWAESVDKLKFLTLTLKHSNAPLHDQICNLYKFFQAFRKLKYLRDNMHGGVWFFQITKSKKTGQWHPHLHCLIDSNFMSQEKLSALWCRTTLGSIIVDIRSVSDMKRVAEYVGRYSARPSVLADMELVDRVELMTALHGRRLVGTWGTAKDTVLAMKKPDDASMWKYVGSWSTVWGTLSDDESARKIFNAWRMDKPLDEGVDMYHIETSMGVLPPPTLLEPVENKQMYLDFSGVLPF